MSGFKRRVVERKGMKKQKEFEDKLLVENLEDLAEGEVEVGEVEDFLDEE